MSDGKPQRMKMEETTGVDSDSDCELPPTPSVTDNKPLTKSGDTEDGTVNAGSKPKELETKKRTAPPSPELKSFDDSDGDGSDGSGSDEDANGEKEKEIEEGKILAPLPLQNKDPLTIGARRSRTRTRNRESVRSWLGQLALPPAPRAPSSAQP